MTFQHLKLSRNVGDNHEYTSNKYKTEFDENNDFFRMSHFVKMVTIFILA